MVGKNLKSLRLKRNLKQQDIADFLKVSRSAICDWERDKSNPSLEILKELKDFFGVSYDDFFEEEE